MPDEGGNRIVNTGPSFPTVGDEVHEIGEGAEGAGGRVGGHKRVSVALSTVG